MPSVINSDDGVVSGTSGLKTTGGNDGLLNIQTNGSTAMSVNASQQVTFNNGANLPNTFGFKNRLINSDMRIDQRNAGASVTPTNSQYLVDRWQASLTQASKYTAQQNAGAVTPPAGFRNYLGFTSSSAYSVLTGDIFGFGQIIEGFNVADLGWGTANAQAVTLSFWVRSSLTGSFGGAIKNDGDTRNYPFTFTISAVNTWEQKTVTIPGDTSGTWGSTNGAGINIRFSLGCGSTYSGTAGAWTGTNIWQPTGSTSVVGTNGATFYITGVQLEKGSTATSFDFRSYGTELELCQRYLPAFDSTGSTFRLPASGVASTSNTVFFTITFPVTTRVPATGLFVSSAGHFAAGVDGLVVQSPASALVFNALSSNNAGRVQMTTSTSPFSANQPAQLDAISASGILYFTGCEL